MRGIALKNRALKRFLRQKLAVLSLVIILVFSATVAFADRVTPFNYHEQGEMLNAQPMAVDKATNKIHWFGTDNLGQDIFARLLYGTRVSLFIGLTADAIIVLIGVVVGLMSGYFGGIVDDLLMRFTDVMYAFPSLLFAMIVVATLGRSIPAILLALGVSNWITIARVVRGQVLLIKQTDYVLSAYSVGAKPVEIIRRHILPNILSPVIVLATLAIPGLMTAEASLAFLGVGVDPSLPTLGKLINAGMGTIFSYPGQIIFPVATLATVTLAFTLVGDGLQDALDPRSF